MFFPGRITSTWRLWVAASRDPSLCPARKAPRAPAMAVSPKWGSKYPPMRCIIHGIIYIYIIYIYNRHNTYAIYIYIVHYIYTIRILYLSIHHILYTYMQYYMYIIITNYNMLEPHRDPSQFILRGWYIRDPSHHPDSQVKMTTLECFLPSTSKNISINLYRGFSSNELSGYLIPST